MNCKEQKKIISLLEKEVHEGLTAFPKYLSSKFFYDSAGDALFQEIMELPEYYLTRTEYEIFKIHKSDIIQSFDKDRVGFDLIELGAGDGKKTKVLLQELVDQNMDFKYIPIDISQNAVLRLEENLEEELPEVFVQGQVGEYFEVLDRLKEMSDRKKVIMFLGSNIGNLLHPKAIDFFKKLSAAMHSEDLLFIGFDQKKHPQKVLDAYNDQSGVTAAFNKNVLVRINKELDANFDPDKFIHWETYNPETGTAKSYLISIEKQTVDINGLALEVHFEAWESIHTEISQKYDDDTVEWLIKESGLKMVASFSDSEHQFRNHLIGNQ